jgi:hypothetical protein
MNKFSMKWIEKRFDCSIPGKPRCKLCGSSIFVTIVDHWESHSLLQRFLVLLGVK